MNTVTIFTEGMWMDFFPGSDGTLVQTFPYSTDGVWWVTPAGVFDPAFDIEVRRKSYDPASADYRQFMVVGRHFHDTDNTASILFVPGAGWLPPVVSHH